MLAYGRHEKEYYHLGVGPNQSILYLIEVKKNRKQKRGAVGWEEDWEESWEHNLKSKQVGAVLYAGITKVELTRPLELDNLSTYPKDPDNPKKFQSLSVGIHEFELVTVQMAHKLGEKEEDFAITTEIFDETPKAVFGLALTGLARAERLASFDHREHLLLELRLFQTVLQKKKGATVVAEYEKLRQRIQSGSFSKQAVA